MKEDLIAYLKGKEFGLVLTDSEIQKSLLGAEKNAKSECFICHNVIKQTLLNYLKRGNICTFCSGRVHNETLNTPKI